MHLLLNLAVGGRFTYVDSNGDGLVEPLPLQTILTSFANPAAPPQLRVEYVRWGGWGFTASQRNASREGRTCSLA